MTRDRWALSAAMFSMIIKRAAVARAFPGGVEEFERIYQPSQKNGALFLLPLSSLDDVEHVLGRLDRAGVIPGQDIAVGDMMHGPVLACPGILFEDVSKDDFQPQWIVNVDRELDGPELAQENKPPSLVQPAEEVPIPTAAAWHPLLPRQGYAGGIDYLCVRQASQGIELAVCGHAWIAEVPGDWFDDDGEPLPEHRDADGGLRLPSSWDGQIVTGIEEDMLVGELTADNDRVIQIDSNRADSLAQALAELYWDEGDPGQLRAMIQRLIEEGSEHSIA